MSSNSCSSLGAVQVPGRVTLEAVHIRREVMWLRVCDELYLLLLVLMRFLRTPDDNSKDLKYCSNAGFLIDRNRKTRKAIAG